MSMWKLEKKRFEMLLESDFDGDEEALVSYFPELYRHTTKARLKASLRSRLYAFVKGKNKKSSFDFIGCSIDELKEQSYFIDKKGKVKINGKFGHTSELTTKIIQDIFSKDNCLLPTLKDSSYLHKELFRIFNKHLKKTLNKDVKLCPIT